MHRSALGILRQVLIIKILIIKFLFVLLDIIVIQKYNGT